jgi:hypothetical protein
VASVFLSYRSGEDGLAGDVHVALLTKEALKSHFIPAEIGTSRAFQKQRGTPIIPILIAQAAIPDFIRDLNAISIADDSDGSDSSFPKASAFAKLRWSTWCERQLNANAARREQLETKLAATEEPPPLLHPEMARTTARRSQSSNALEEPDSRCEATEALRGLVDAIVLTRDRAGETLQNRVEGKTWRPCSARPYSAEATHEDKVSDGASPTCREPAHAAIAQAFSHPAGRGLAGGGGGRFATCAASPGGNQASGHRAGLFRRSLMRTTTGWASVAICPDVRNSLRADAISSKSRP